MHESHTTPSLKHPGFGRATTTRPFGRVVLHRFHRGKAFGAGLWRRYLAARRQRKHLAALPILSPDNNAVSPKRLDQYYAPSRYFEKP